MSILGQFANVAKSAFYGVNPLGLVVFAGSGRTYQPVLFAKITIGPGREKAQSRSAKP
jgi:hypothetical protein